MVKYILLALGGIVGGFLGGMGMGGGTLLIPILSVFFNFEQKVAQAFNLFSFIPMAIIALIVHAKNKLINMKGLLLLTICSLLASCGGSFLAQKLHSETQTKLFGAFLTLLAVIKFICSLKNSLKKRS